MEQVWCELEDDEEYKNEIRNFQKQKVMVQEDIFQNHIEQKKKEKETEFDVVKEMNKVTTQKELMEINDVENSSFVVIDEPNLDETFESWKDLFEQSNIPLVELNNVEDQISNIEIHEWKSVITDQNFTKHLSNQAKQNLQLRLKMEEEILYGEKMKLRMKIFEKEENKETPNGYKDWKSFFTQFCKIENEEKAEKYSEKMIEEQFDLKNWNLLVKEDLEGIVEEEEELKRITTLISEFVLVLITWEDIFKKYNVSNEQYKLAEEELSEYEVSDLIELGEEYEFPDFLSEKIIEKIKTGIKMDKEPKRGLKMKLRLQLFEKEENKETPNGYKDWKSFFTQFCKIENEEKAEKYSEKMIEEQFDLKNWNLLVKEDLEGIVEEEEELKRITTLISEFVLVLITWEDIFKKYNVSNEQYKLAEEELSEYEVSDLIELGEEYEFPDFLSEKIIEKIKTGIKMDKEPKRGLKMKLRLQLFEKEENKETPNGYENWDSFFKIIFGSNNEKIGNCSKMMTEEQFDLKNWNFLTNEDISFMDDSETILKFIECSASPNEGFKWRTLLIQEKLIDSHAQYKVPGEFNSWENFFRVALKDAKNVTEEEITNYSNYFDSNDFLLCHWKFLVHNKNQILKNAGVRSPYFNKIGVLIKNLKD